jgi:3-methylcrotonyl-CoA carboxylase alpha subunit
MIAKIIVWGTDRPAAIARMEATLRETRVTGVKTNLPLLRAIVADEAYRSGDTTTRFLDDRDAFLALDTSGAVPLDVKHLAAGALIASDRAWRMAGVGIPIDLVLEGVALRTTVERHGRQWRTDGELGPAFSVERRGNDVVVVADGRTIVGDVRLDADGGRIVHSGRTYLFAFSAPPDADARRHAAAAGTTGNVTSPMPGKIVSVNVAPGDVVEARALLVVLEAMKMEHRIEAPLAGTIEGVHVALGDLVASETALVTIGV